MSENVDGMDPLEELEAAAESIIKLLDRTFPQHSIRESDRKKIARWSHVVRSLDLMDMREKISEREAELGAHAFGRRSKANSRADSRAFGCG